MNREDVFQYYAKQAACRVALPDYQGTEREAWIEIIQFELSLKQVGLDADADEETRRDENFLSL